MNGEEKSGVHENVAVFVGDLMKVYMGEYSSSISFKEIEGMAVMIFRLVYSRIYKVASVNEEHVNDVKMCVRLGLDDTGSIMSKVYKVGLMVMQWMAQHSKHMTNAQRLIFLMAPQVAKYIIDDMKSRQWRGECVYTYAYVFTREMLRGFQCMAWDEVSSIRIMQHLRAENPAFSIKSDAAYYCVLRACQYLVASTHRPTSSALEKPDLFFARMTSNLCMNSIKLTCPMHPTSSAESSKNHKSVCSLASKKKIKACIDFLCKTQTRCTEWVTKEYSTSIHRQTKDLLKINMRASTELMIKRAGVSEDGSQPTPEAQPPQATTDAARPNTIRLPCVNMNGFKGHTGKTPRSARVRKNVKRRSKLAHVFMDDSTSANPRPASILVSAPVNATMDGNSHDGADGIVFVTPSSADPSASEDSDPYSDSAVAASRVVNTVQLMRRQSTARMRRFLATGSRKHSSEN